MKEPDDRSRRCFLKSSSMLGLAVAFSPATICEAFAESKSKTAQKEKTMTQSSATQRSSEQPSDKTSIRPFHVNTPEAELAELRRRINATKWPPSEYRSSAVGTTCFTNSAAAGTMRGSFRPQTMSVVGFPSFR